MRSKAFALAAGVSMLAATSGYGKSPAPQPAPAFPATLPPVAKAGEPDGGQSPAWSMQDIQLAQARCSVLLKGLDVVAVPEAPLREEAECGNPAPMRLISVGRQPEVSFSPPPTVTCDMIAALHKWMQKDVQPTARKFMGAPVVRVEVMSAYSCRNAYGRAHGRLSEHGKANAIDVGSFVTALGKGALVVADWGPTAREIEAAVAESKAQKAPLPVAATPQVTTTIQSADRRHTIIGVAPASEPAAAAASMGFSIPIPGVRLELGSRSDTSADPGLASPNRLGGPKPSAVRTDAPMDFLRAVHKSACKHFGTVLGPEANNAHKNHFHIDMADRPRGAICE